jgi:nucleoid DNA-binding protein
VDINKEENKMIMEKIFFHLLETLQLCSKLDLSGLGPLEQKEWNDRIQLCKNALEFTKNSVEKLSKFISPKDPSYS